jgi:diguanylate cyclase (GGDEF)-like protein
MLKTLKEYLKKKKKEIDEIKLYFKKCAVEIDRSNLYMLRRSCMYTSIVFVCMLFFAVTCIPGFNVTLGHILMAVMLIAYFFINALIRKRGSISTVQTATVCLFFYFLVGMSFILIEMLSNITNHTRWLPLLLMIFPVLFIDRLYKYVIEEAFLIAVYAAISWFYKDPIMFSRDFYTVIAAFILSQLVERIILGVRSKQGLAMVELRRYSSVDKLTHVYNKGALLEEMDSYLEENRGTNPCAMCIIDVDSFKQVNDSLGHNGGDLLLEHIGKLLLENFRPTDIIGRFGGDEFIVFMPGMKDSQLVELRCRSVQMMLTDFYIGNSEPFSLSIGVIIDEGSHSREELFRMADDALYKSKMAGKNRCTSWVVYNNIEDDLPMMIVASSLKEDERDFISKEEKDRFHVFYGGSDDEVISCISQYEGSVRLIVVEMRDDADVGILVLKYVKERERFNHIPVLAVCCGDESRKLAVRMGADRVMNSEDSLDLLKNNIGELGGI